MPSNIYFANTASHAGFLRNSLSQLELGREGLSKLVAAMGLMLNGDGSLPAHFDEIVIRFGFPSTTIAKAAWDELNAANFKLQTDASVTAVKAALDQLFTKFR